jgi:polyhydroxyalkanoate synthase
MDNKDFVEYFVRMERWIFDSPDVPGETFRQFIEDCYKNNLLIQSKMYVGGQRVDLKKLTMPLLNFYGKFDHLVPPEACDQLSKVVGSKDVEDICLETGHIGIYVSSKFQKQFAPKIAQWLKERDQADIPLQKAQTVSKSAFVNQRQIARPGKPVPGKKQPKKVDKIVASPPKRPPPKGKSLLMQKIAEAI